VKLKLGKLPSTRGVRITISLSEALKEQLDRYAALHFETYEQKVNAATLIPYFVEQYLANDRVFKRREKELAMKS